MCYGKRDRLYIGKLIIEVGVTVNIAFKVFGGLYEITAKSSQKTV